MFRLGFWEVVTILVVIVVFVRPQDLPRFARNAGKVYAKIRAFYRDLSSLPERVEDEIARSAREPGSVSRHPSKQTAYRRDPIPDARAEHDKGSAGA